MQGNVPCGAPFNFMSLFSGAGIGDYGFQLAGGVCLAACEIDPNRRAVHKRNVDSPVWGDIRKDADSLIDFCRKSVVDLLVATPPCQGFSTANAKRGKRDCHSSSRLDQRNNLFFEALNVANALKPKVILFENVPNFLEKSVIEPVAGNIGKIREFISAGVSDVL